MWRCNTRVLLIVLIVLIVQLIGSETIRRFTFLRCVQKMYMGNIPFVGKRFSVDEFAAYLQQVQFSSFQPISVTLHHTSAPSLAQRPNGFSDQHLQNLLDYYQNQLGWSGAPHLFIDDQPKGIIVFQRLDRRGVHAVSFNKQYWGVEMLGDYDNESFTTGRGAAVRDLAMQALAKMLIRLNAPASSLKFHRDDPLTSKTCPGLHVNKDDVVQRVQSLINSELHNVDSPWLVQLADKTVIKPIHMLNDRPMAPIRSSINTILPGGEFQASANLKTVTWTPPSLGSVTLPSHTIPIAYLDADGNSWAYIRDIADAAGKEIVIVGYTMTLK